MNIPSNKSLYEKVKKETKKRFKVWPSAYASAYLVKEYKRRGCKYIKSKKSRRKSRKVLKKTRKPQRKSRKVSRKPQRKSRKVSRKPQRKSSEKNGLGRWFAEKWIDVCYYPRIVECGRKSGGYSGNYPYCRPLKRITSRTPRTVKEMSASERRRRCSLKRCSPKKRLLR